LTEFWILVCVCVCVTSLRTAEFRRNT